ncbi:MAG: hypothetical protein ACM3X6_04730 [Patescibacteria group bacterium]
MSVKVEKVAYGGWQNCYRVANGRLELIVTADVGPRVIRLGFAGGPNEFCEFPEYLGRTGGSEWVNYGGHRLWHSPETRARTYQPDNDPVAVEMTAAGLRAEQRVEAGSGIKKSIVLTMDPEKPAVIVEHYLKNEGLWPVELSVWCLSVMAPGGVSLVPQTTHRDEEGLLPNRTLTLWPYTEMSDPRITWGRGLVRLRQDESMGPVKYGMSVAAGWGAYANHGNLFLKEFAYDDEAVYPDGGCSVEVYACERFLELETLSPLYLVEPGETVSHTESWSLHAGFKLPDRDEEAIAAVEKLLG